MDASNSGGGPGAIEIESGKPTMFYFPLAGRAELSRLIAAAGNLEIDEKAEIEDKSVYGSPGSLPVLSHGNLKMAQSGAIENYLAIIAPNFRNLTPAERAKDMMFACIKEDVLAGCAGVIFGELSEAPDKAPAHFDKWFKVVEDLLPASGFVNGKPFPTVADLAVLNMTTGYMPFGAAMKHGKYQYDMKYPKMKALADLTAAAPGVKEYLAKTETTNAAAFGK